MNLAPDETKQAGDRAHCVRPGSIDQSAQAIVTCVGMVGPTLAAIVGYLVESAATGGTAGLAGALVCPLVFVAIYRSFPQPGA